MLQLKLEALPTFLTMRKIVNGTIVTPRTKICGSSYWRTIINLVCVIRKGVMFRPEHGEKKKCKPGTKSSKMNRSKLIHYKQ